MSSFLRDVFRVGVSNGLLIIFGLLTSMVTARYLGPEKNGVIAALLVYPSIFMSIGSLGIRQSTTYYLGKKIFSEDAIKTGITQIWLFTTVFSIAVCFFLMYTFSNSANNLLWIILALLPIPFSLFNTYNSGLFLGKNDLKTFNRINWLPSLIIFLTTILFVVILNFDISGSMLALIMGPCCLSFVLLFKNKFIKYFSFKIDWTVIKAMLSLGVVYAIALLIINLNYRVDIIFLDKLSTPYEMGIYAKGASITQYLWQIPMLLSTVVFMRSATAKDDRSFSLKTAMLLRLSFIGVGLIAFVLFLFSDLIIDVMYGVEFAKSSEVLNILLPGVIILTIFKVMNMDLAGKGKPWVAMKAMIPALIINIVLDFILVAKYGSIGTSYSSTISYSVGGLLFLYFYSRETGIGIAEILLYRKSDFNFIPDLLDKVKNRK